jgi:magnesium-transporting ATPase (P-type)
VTDTGRKTRLRTSSIVWRWVSLASATLWAVGVGLFVFGYHINEPVGELSVTTGGRTYVGNPPALSLHEKNGTMWEIALFLIGLVLVAGATDLVVRTLRQSTGLGILAIAGGGLLVLYSLFGLIYGLLGVGTIGVLVVLVGLPMKADTKVEPAPAAQD